jgi:hypothetical protein
MKSNVEVCGLLASLSAVLAVALMATNQSRTSNAVAAAGGSAGFAGKVQVAGSPISGSTTAVYAVSEGPERRHLRVAAKSS